MNIENICFGSEKVRTLFLKVFSIIRGNIRVQLDEDAIVDLRDKFNELINNQHPIIIVSEQVEQSFYLLLNRLQEEVAR